MAQLNMNNEGDNLIEMTIRAYKDGTMPKLITAEELAQRIYIPKDKILELCRQGRFPCVDIPGLDEPRFHLQNATDFAKNRLFIYQEAQIYKFHVHTDTLFENEEVPRCLRSMLDQLHKFDMVDIPCIYFLCHRGEVVYVGQSTTLATRVVSHQADKLFDAVFFLPVRTEQLDEIEQKYILALRPKYNTVYPKWERKEQEP